ncbi:MAG: diaminopimelate decarboxylase family protein [Candidatus Limnocylindrales bacterium]
MTEAGDLAAVAPGLRAAARRFGTPLYLTEAAGLTAAAAELRAAFPDPWIRQYSVKANDVAPIVARLAAAGLGANVVSRGEWAIARRAGRANDRITLEGVGKTDADLRAAVRAAAGGEPLRWVAIESADEAARLAGLARNAGLAGLDVLLRFNPAVEPETQLALAVGAGTSKFGLADDELAAAIEAGGGADGPLRWRGIHLHVGSQLGAVDAWRDAVRRALAIVALVGGGLADFDTLDVGGGFPVATAGEVVPRPERFARELPALLETVPADRRPSRLAVEPGRFLVARAGWLIGAVLHVRERGGRMVVLDAGMTELIRPALYSARHRIVALTSLGRSIDPRSAAGARSAADEPAEVHGPICESTDALGRHDLPPLHRGDLVAIRDAGAYGASFGSTYNGRLRPPQVILEPDGRLTLARRRGSLAALG